MKRCLHGINMLEKDFFEKNIWTDNYVNFMKFAFLIVPIVGTLMVGKIFFISGISIIGILFALIYLAMFASFFVVNPIKVFTGGIFIKKRGLLEFRQKFVPFNKINSFNIKNTFWSQPWELFRYKILNVKSEGNEFYSSPIFDENGFRKATREVLENKEK